ncbi:MAG: hypothetical protein JXA21_26145 [Anaerolineae bacterium]|nr:hypothetical protein [Anaerolineae bacterium]
MLNSYAKYPTLVCPACDRSFSPEIWVIVDLTEHPELVDRICDDTLHDVRCPACNYVGTLDVPLLLYHPSIDPPLLFSPSRRGSEEQDREHAAGLVNRLRESLGYLWSEEWLSNGLQSVPRHELPVMLGKGNPEV